MAYFIGRDKYFSFTENVKEDNKINKLTIPVLNSITDPSNKIFKTSTKHRTTVEYDYSIGKADGTNVLPLKNISYPSWTETYQSSYEELNKYKIMYYRIMGLPVEITKTTTERDWFGIAEPFEKDYVTTEMDTVYGENKLSSVEDCSDSDWVTLESGSCSIDSNFLASVLVSTGTYASTMSYSSDGNKITYKDYIRKGIYRYYDYMYVELYGNEYTFNYADIVKESDMNNKIKYNYDFDENPFIQNGAKYGGRSIENYISNTIFKNYSQSRPVATLEWIGSPEVDLGTDLKIEPRRQYIEDELITYTVVGKDINYNGGYREKLYLIKKEAD